MKTNRANALLLWIITSVLFASCTPAQPHEIPHDVSTTTSTPITSAVPVSTTEPEIPVNPYSGDSYYGKPFIHYGQLFQIGVDIVDFDENFRTMTVLWNEAKQAGHVLLFGQSEETHVDVTLYSISNIDWVWSGHAPAGTFTFVDKSVCFYYLPDGGTLIDREKEWMIFQARTRAWAHMQDKEMENVRYGAGYRLMPRDACSADADWFFIDSTAYDMLAMTGGGLSQFDPTGQETFAQIKQILADSFTPDAPRTAEEILSRAK